MYSTSNSTAISNFINFLRCEFPLVFAISQDPQYTRSVSRDYIYSCCFIGPNSQDLGQHPFCLWHNKKPLLNTYPSLSMPQRDNNQEYAKRASESSLALIGRQQKNMILFAILGRPATKPRWAVFQSATREMRNDVCKDMHISLPVV